MSTKHNQKQYIDLSKTCRLTRAQIVARIGVEAYLRQTVPPRHRDTAWTGRPPIHRTSAENPRIPNPKRVLPDHAVAADQDHNRQRRISPVLGIRTRPVRKLLDVHENLDPGLAREMPDLRDPDLAV